MGHKEERECTDALKSLTKGFLTVQDADFQNNVTFENSAHQGTSLQSSCLLLTILGHKLQAVDVSILRFCGPLNRRRACQEEEK